MATPAAKPAQSLAVNRRVRLRLAGCPPPSGAVTRGGKLEIVINLKSAFHHGYIDLHGKPPASGTNPLLDEYSNLLVDSDYLIWSPPGIAGDDDARSGESHRLGRALSRAYLQQHCNYTWFAHISELTRTARGGWSVKQKAKGDMPDWLISDGGNTAVAEAKGRSRSLNSGLKKWRQQVQNVIVLKDGGAVSLPTYIVANRWVNSKQRVKPEIYVEDPPTEGRELTDEDSVGVAVWTMQVHTARNLMRLGQRALAARVLIRSSNENPSPIRVLVWRCVLPGLEHLRFIGRRVPHPSGFQCNDMLAVLESIVYNPESWRTEYKLFPWFMAAVQEWRERAYFDGVLIDSVKSSLVGRAMPALFETRLPVLPEDVSLLGDGSLIAPASLMVPYDILPFE